jgi:hypothetical protein
VISTAPSDTSGALADSVLPWYTPAILRLDPIWDPLRERADFKKLVAQR